jgi:hypothetical protein
MDTVMALNRKLQQQQKSYFLNGFSSGFHLPNQFCYTHRHDLTLETLECFLSKSTNYMHILSSGPE